MAEELNKKPQVCEIQWIPVTMGHPAKNTHVLVRRLGGTNNHNEVSIAKWVHKYGSPSHCYEWHDLVGSGWGISVDGSVITHWAEFPRLPYTYL